MKKQSYSFELPLLLDVPDYHEVIYQTLIIQLLIGKNHNVRYEQLFCMGNYVAVVFEENNKPLLEEMIELLLIKKFTPEFLDSVYFRYDNTTPTIDEMEIISQKIKLGKGIAGNEVVARLNKL